MDTLFYITAVVGCTAIIVNSLIFEPIRNVLDNGNNSLRKNPLGLGIKCPQCVGFWVGVVFNYFGVSLVNPNFYEDIYCEFVFDFFIVGSSASFISYSVLSLFDLLFDFRDIMISNVLEKD